MPLFDFQCNRCGAINEHLVLGGDVPACPSCGDTDLKKLAGAPAPSGKSRGMIARARQAAGAAGHLSNFSPSERRGGK